jgi:integrase
MPRNEGTLLSLTGGVRLKPRVQHPKILECETKNPYFYFRYWDDVIQSDGTLKPVRKKHVCGPSKGENAITKKAAAVIRDEFFAKQNAPTEKVAIAKGQALLGQVARMYIASHLERRNKVSEPTRQKERLNLENHIIPKWGKHRLCELTPKEVEDWLYSLRTPDGEEASWWTMHGIKATMSALYHRAEDWGLWEEGKRTPLVKVNIGKKTYKRERRILSWEETAAVLAKLEDPNRLVIETCIATSTRISEVLGLTVKHVDLDRGLIRIEQRNWRQDVDDPKTDGSRRLLALGNLVDRYRAWIATLKNTGDDAWVFPQSTDPEHALWDSGVRQALHKAAVAVGCDFNGLGPHSFRRANITWRQAVGGSAIEASKIAGHAEVDMTGEYTFVDLERQQELTVAIQERLAATTVTNGVPSINPARRQPPSALRRAKKDETGKKGTLDEIPNDFAA